MIDNGRSRTASTINNGIEVTVNNAWYNTEQGVADHLYSLLGFNFLLDIRRIAGYERHESLREFKILEGKYRLDSCGNIWKRVDENTYSLSGDIPLPGLTCPVCKDSWAMENIDDTVVRRDEKVVSLADFAGHTLGNVKANYRSRRDAIYREQPELLIRNDAHIDLSPEYPGATEDWKKGMVKNKRGWVGKKEGITDNYVIKEGDEGFFNVWAYFHKACSRKDLEVTYMEKFREVFEKAGFNGVELKPIPNQYCGCDQCAPWYEIKTSAGKITAGWRKRVINIDWANPDLDGKVLFSDEDVTKGATYVHAWGWDKAVEYLARLRKGC